MSDRTLAWCGAVILAAGLGASPAGGQDRDAAWEPLRLSDGRPDLQGVWDFRTATPFQRPEGFGERLTEEQAAAIEAGAAAAQQAADRPPTEGNVGAYNAFWLDFGTNVGADRRASLIVDPVTGRLPELAEGVARQVGSLDVDLSGERPWRVRSAGIGADGPEDRGLAERCLVGFNSGPPMMPSAYNNNMQLFQTSDHVVILNEMVHDVRVIPLHAGEHLPATVPQWSGDSRGRWEGDTLVVESQNFSDKRAAFEPNALLALGVGSTLRLVERFTRVGEDTLLYEYTVDDLETFTEPFTAAVPMRQSENLIYEYACHEGNYGMINALSGARAAELENEH
ncbi:MAG: hypothetical protein VYE68_09885 [Acidobacteriota bacterium]|nr:hypothetical protein [Acidobacteriota bacterium]